MSDAPKDRGGDLARVYANAPQIPDYLDKPFSELNAEDIAAKGAIYAKHEADSIQNMPWETREGGEKDFIGRVHHTPTNAPTMADRDESVTDTLNALGYEFPNETGKNDSAAHGRPLTVKELEERAEAGEPMSINAGIMRRYGKDEKTGKRPADVMAAAAGAQEDYDNAAFRVEHAKHEREKYGDDISNEKVAKAEKNLDAADTRVGSTWQESLSLVKPSAPINRANDSKRTVQDPWASDPAGPNEGWNASQAREMFEHNSDSILRENSGPTKEEQDNDPTEFDPSAYSNEDIESYRHDKD